MSHYWSDNVHTTAFTPRDYQVELIAAAVEKNVMICLGHNSSKEFIVLKLLQELAPSLRKKEDNNRKIAIYITYESNGESIYNLIYHLTDLKVFHYRLSSSTNATNNKEINNDIEEDDDDDNVDLKAEIAFKEGYQIFILDVGACQVFLSHEFICLENIIFIIEDCHEITQQENIVNYIFSFFDDKLKNKPKVLGLAGPLHNAECQPQELKAILEIFEENIFCKAETASDIVTVLRYCTRPSEYIIQCAPQTYNDLVKYLEETIYTRITFINDHRFDPSEIYSDEFLDELKAIPDPKIEPIKFLENYLDVLHEMGPWCADRAAFMLLSQIEKQKVKTPYERHFLLLCMVSTTLVQIRAYCDYLFQKTSNECERVEKYSSPKIIRLLQILRRFKPEDIQQTDNESLAKISDEIDVLDFQKLQINIENTYQNIENREELNEIGNVLENLESILHDENAHNYHQQKIENLKNKDSQHKLQNVNAGNNTKDVNSDLSVSSPTTTATTTTTARNRHKRGNKHFPHMHRNRHHHHHHYHHHHHHHHYNQNESDSLCGILFCNDKNTAKILFDLLCEMSRHDPELLFLSVQYTVDRQADPITESKEAELEHRRQEEVLKRFRTHECNLLIGTSVLEEGIDLPKCNLVIRWDPPTSYRSYVQCKGRARAPQAFHIILVAPKLYTNKTLLDKHQEYLSNRSHRYICCISENNVITDDNDENALKNDEKQDVETEKNIEEEKSQNDCIENEKNENKIKMEFSTEAIIDKNNDSRDQNKLQKIEENEKPKNGIVKKSNEEYVFTVELFEDLINNSLSKIDKYKNSSSLNTSSNASPSSSSDLSKTNSFETSESNKDDNVKSVSNKKKIKKQQKNQECVVKELEVLNADLLLKQNLLKMEEETNYMIEQIAQYREIEKLLLQKCANTEPSETENYDADKYTGCIESYKPLPNMLTGASVDLGTAISLINKYCAKLPSDTFTKLTPLWRYTKTIRNEIDLYQYTLRLPINSPLKHDILGLPMPSRVLARRVAALIACRELHKCGELDNNLQPIGKEGFKASEPDWEDFELEKLDEKIVNENSEPRPGTTKRRQYYYKKIASEFSNCRPTIGTESYLYLINMTLKCPIPEEQNTRGRKIYPPEDAMQGFGILTLKKIPKVSAFPIFTRSGEVKVSIDLSKDKYILNEKQIERINVFVNYTFTNVLRLQKFLMLFDPNASENCIYIVPTVKKDNNSNNNNNNITIDWDFLETIYNNCDKMPRPIPDDIRKNLQFDPDKFKDAVVMPWYRNQDQPQYFYVAEICYHLSPESCFPGENYSTFQQYYYLKYGIIIQNSKQPLLDVDHTSARLNFLTPRYVNRKGVALPTSSEETKRAKRENLEQKQILVPELCTIHPFPASLWRAAVCLPCILYRINGLLLADEIRKKVSYDLGLGRMEIEDENFEWPILDFGWSLTEVLKKSRETKDVKDIIKQNNCNNNKNSIKNDDSDVDDDDDNDKKENCEDKQKIVENDLNEENSSKNNEDEIKEDGFKDEKTANDLLEEADEKLKNDILSDIGIWSNDMADNINSDKEYDGEDWGLLPPEVNLCSRNKTNIRYGSPTSWDTGATTNHHNHHSYRHHNNNALIDAYYTDSDASFQSDDDYDMISINTNDDEDHFQTGALHIEFKSNNVAEAIETEEEQLKRQKQLAILHDTCLNEKNYQNTKNLKIGYKFIQNLNDNNDNTSSSSSLIIKKMKPFENEFIKSTEIIKNDIKNSGMLIQYNQNIELKKKKISIPQILFGNMNSFKNLLPYINITDLENFFINKKQINIHTECTKLTIDDLYELNEIYLKNSKIENEKYKILGSGDIFDNFIDSELLKIEKDEKIICIDLKKSLIKFNDDNNDNDDGDYKNQQNDEQGEKQQNKSTLLIEKKLNFSFDYQPNLIGHPGPSPSIILQALTMSNANDGINLERLETIGDSFLKYAITTYLYCKYENVHEGKLSHLRSKQVSNLNLYRLGRKKVFGECMIATKFEPHDNWLPPCYYVPKELEKALIEAKIPPCHWNLADLPNIKELSSEKICELVKKKAESLGLIDDDELDEIVNPPPQQTEVGDDFPCFIPYNLVTQHSIPDKSVADCVEALIGAYLIECGPRGALLFMAWLGIRVLPIIKKQYDSKISRIPGSTQPDNNNEIIIYGEWTPPKSPLLKFSPNPYKQLNYLLDGFNEFENKIGYSFKDRSYLLQAMTHASYSPNRLTDCYQRLEFLGDAVLDYLITRHLYEDPRQHSPGALTDLRSALVNNTIFASLAVRHGFHKYFKHLSPGLNEVIDRFVRIQHENGHSISEEYYLLSEEECDDAEDVEVPKALGDVFESVAGAIFLDSNMSLDAVWKVYSNMMKPEIEQFSNSVPKSPIRELLELEPETAKFGKPEKLADGRRVRVTVEVFGKGTFRGIGRNYRIAKCTAAKCALRQLKKQGLISKKH